MTHTEAASIRVGCWMHANTAPLILGETVEQCSGQTRRDPTLLQALAADLLSLNEIPCDWDANRRLILSGGLDVVATFRTRDYQVQTSVGWPPFEMTLQNGNAPVNLRGIVRARTGPGAGCWSSRRSSGSA
jgi:hypothetical protein